MLSLLAVLYLSGCVNHREGFVGGTVNITGLALGANISNYTLEIGKGMSPKNWTTLGIVLNANSKIDVNQSLLASWNTSKLEDGRYKIRLTVTDSKGVTSQDSVYVTVDNFPDPPTRQCPAWSCGSLHEGSNTENIELRKEQYGSNMDCSVACECPEGTYAGVYSSGYTEPGYDILHLNEENLSNYWELFTPMNRSRADIRFTSDRGVDGTEDYSGFRISDIECSRYCLMTNTSTSYYFFQYITRLILNTGIEYSGPSYYTSNLDRAFTNITRGENYTLRVDVTVTRSSGDIEFVGAFESTQHLKIWIDYDQDYDFSDPGEEIDLGTIDYNLSENENSTTHTFQKVIRVPMNAALGPTRMRIYDLDEGIQVPEPCKQSFSGEAEDYIVDISNATTTECTIKGDFPPCGDITLKEIIQLISQWSLDSAKLSEVISIINAWENS